MVVEGMVWDRDDALRRMGNKTERLSMMISIFMEESEDYLINLDKAFSEKDVAGLRSSAHAIKGAAGNLGAQRVYKMAQEIES